ncbi:MAG: hypothetical protein JST20_04855 [Bacteroidetes bacterium]|nr:hypothetical protein [Bacteroidota bacterium]
MILKLNLLVIIIFICLEFLGCAQIIDDNRLLYDYKEHIGMDEIQYINSKIIKELKIDTNKYILFVINRYTSYVDGPKPNRFVTQLLVSIKSEITSGDCECDIYKYTNYSDKIYIGKLDNSSSMCNIIDKYIQEIVKNKKDTTLPWTIMHEFDIYINYNDKKLYKNILDVDHETIGIYVSLFSLIKSSIYELELNNQYKQLEN